MASTTNEERAETMAEDKDWTWVLQKKCDECGFDASATSFARLPELFLINALDWRAVLTAAAPRLGNSVPKDKTHGWLTERPEPDVWSPLEYACHVRDVHLLFQARLESMLVDDSPTFADWDGDAAAAEGAYSQQSPDAVAQELLEAARRTADQYVAIAEDQRHRSGLRSDGSRFTVVTLGLYHLHDAAHHLADVRRVANEH